MQNLHVVFAVDRAGIVGADGETHQGTFDVPILTTIPGITVYSPSDYSELKSDLKKALYAEGVQHSLSGLYSFAQASLAKQSNSLTYCLPAVNRHQYL